MKPRNTALHADCARVVELKMQIDRYKAIANRHSAPEQTVRRIISNMMRERRKATNVQIHVEQEVR